MWSKPHSGLSLISRTSQRGFVAAHHQPQLGQATIRGKSVSADFPRKVRYERLAMVMVFEVMSPAVKYT